MTVLSSAGSDEATRINAAAELTEDPSQEVLAFLTRHIASEGSPEVKKAILGGLSATHGEAVRGLLRRYESDENEDLRTLARRRLSALDADAEFQRATRAATERGLSETTEMRQSSVLESLARRSGGALVDAPPKEARGPFSLLPASAPTVRVVAIGDFGTFGSGPAQPQERVAGAIKKAHAAKAFHFGITLGDNFYPNGLIFPNGRWDTDWEKVYGSLGIAFHPVLGNHDWIEGADGELSYTSTTWHMKADYYTFTAGPAQFFAIDTEKMWKGKKEAVRSWLKAELAASTAPWKIVYGHHPVLSGGDHGPDAETKALREQQLLPLLEQAGVPVYLSGHDHDMQLLKRDGVYLVVSGAGGKDTRAVTALPETLFCAEQHGFLSLEVQPATLELRYISIDGDVLYSCTLQKNGPQVGDTCAKLTSCLPAEGIRSPSGMDGRRSR